MALTGLRYTLVDDHVSRWIEEGRARRLVDGVYELVDPMPEPRAVFVTHLHGGLTLIEVGDQELRLYEAEMRALGRLTVGNAMQFAQLQTQADMGALVAQITLEKRVVIDRLSNVERELKAVLDVPGVRAYAERQRKAQAAGQQDLYGG